MSIVNEIISFEQGELDENQTIELFARLVQSGMAWSLQGSYGRTATAFINAGYIDRKGNVLMSY